MFTSQIKQTCIVLILSTLAATSGSAFNDSRTIEFPFKLSADRQSEFRTKARIVSAGPMVIEAQWTSMNDPKQLSPLTLVILRPDGFESVRRTGTSPLRLEHRLNEADIDIVTGPNRSSWVVKLINENDVGQEIEGKLRITVPLSPRTLVNNQFTLLSLGNAQEMAFSVTSPGRLVVEANWQTDPLTGTSAVANSLSLQLVHVAQDKTYARRRGADSLRIEHQVTDLEIDRGLRWIARIQNEGQSKVKGLLKVTFVPSL
jgi:hypothetical protein